MVGFINVKPPSLSCHCLYYSTGIIVICDTPPSGSLIFITSCVDVSETTFKTFFSRVLLSTISKILVAGEYFHTPF